MDLRILDDEVDERSRGRAIVIVLFRVVKKRSSFRKTRGR